MAADLDWLKAKQTIWYCGVRNESVSVTRRYGVAQWYTNEAKHDPVPVLNRIEGCTMFTREGRRTGDRAHVVGLCKSYGLRQNLTPAQNQLRQANANWNRTVLTGAAIGAGTGAAIGAAATRGSGEGAAIGALAGLLVGALASAAVADRNFAFANREISAGQRIDNANQVATLLEERVLIADQVVAQNRATLANLDRQYRARQITAADYRARTESMRADLASIQTAAEQGRAARDEINRTRDLPQLRAAEERIAPAQRRLEGSAAQLEELLSKVPAA